MVDNGMLLLYNVSMRKKHKDHTTVRLTIDGEKMCRAIMNRLGINRTQTVEIAIRRLAVLEGVTQEELDKIDLSVKQY